MGLRSGHGWPGISPGYDQREQWYLQGPLTPVWHWVSVRTHQYIETHSTQFNTYSHTGHAHMPRKQKPKHHLLRMFEFQIPVINKTHRRPPNFSLEYTIPSEKYCMTYTHPHMCTHYTRQPRPGRLRPSCSFFFKCDRRRKTDFITSFTKFIRLIHFIPLHLSPSLCLSLSFYLPWPLMITSSIPRIFYAYLQSGLMMLIFHISLLFIDVIVCHWRSIHIISLSVSLSLSAYWKNSCSSKHTPLQCCEIISSIGVLPW